MQEDRAVFKRLANSQLEVKRLSLKQISGKQSDPSDLFPFEPITKTLEVQINFYLNSLKLQQRHLIT